MCPTTHQAPFATGCAHAAFPCAVAPFAAAHMTACHRQTSASAIVSSGQTLARALPVLEANGTGAFTSYPATHAADADNALLHTYASFHEEPIVALSANKRHDDTWTLCVPVPLPATQNPTLLSLTYLVKYGTIGDEGNAILQTDVLLTTTSLSAGVVAGEASSVYRDGTGYAPRMVDPAAALCLATALAVKSSGGGEQWSHFFDVQNVASNVRVGAGAGLYVMFHVAENPTARTVRSLAVEVSATWQKEEVELKARAEAERKKREVEEKAAQEATEKKAREADEKRARDEEREWRAEERKAKKAEAEERAEAKQARDEARKWREEERQAQKDREAKEEQARAEQARAEQARAERARAEQARAEQARAEQARAEQARAEQARAEQARAAAKPSPEAAPPVADDTTQDLIKQTMAKLRMDPCPAGYEFVKNSRGYTCKGGSHHVTFEQLGMK
ncbi:hypothetical protein DFH09DRAFT_259626 [Mycena vulgaris]|nr:hypothetical protein DFH09DRAFT_259626 [Mycena vulgaris]